jgi:excisionase family DNA binding protein
MPPNRPDIRSDGEMSGTCSVTPLQATPRESGPEPEPDRSGSLPVRSGSAPRCLREASECATIREAAALLRVHENTIRNWIASGRLEAVQPAGARGRILIPAAALRSLKSEERTEKASGSSTLNEALSAVFERFQRTRKRMKLLRRSDGLKGEGSFG